MGGSGGLGRWRVARERGRGEGASFEPTRPARVSARDASSRSEGTHPVAKRPTTAASVDASSDGALASDTGANGLGASFERAPARASDAARIPHHAARGRARALTTTVRVWRTDTGRRTVTHRSSVLTAVDTCIVMARASDSFMPMPWFL